MLGIIQKSTEQLITQIDSQLKSIEHDNSDNNTDIEPYFKEVKSELKELISITQRDVNNFNQNDAFKMLSYIQSAEATAQLLNTYLLATSSLSGSNKTGASPSKVATQTPLINWVSGTLIPWLKNLGSSIWAAIQKLTTPNEWKLKGGIGSKVFGLANAELEIIFK